MQGKKNLYEVECTFQISQKRRWISPALAVKQLLSFGSHLLLKAI